MPILTTPNPHIIYPQFHHHHHLLLCYGSNPSISPKSNGSGLFGSNEYWKRKSKASRDLKAQASFWPELFKPDTVEMEPIQDCDQFEQILDEAKALSKPIVVDWMAAWCRKCIYLKPKLEKLAAEFDSNVKFYCVDVNNVPQALVKRGNISKMPTIQVWKDGEMKAEVIGGHKAWLVIEEVREMIRQFV